MGDMLSAQNLAISIHAPREGSDSKFTQIRALILGKLTHYEKDTRQNQDENNDPIGFLHGTGCARSAFPSANRAADSCSLPFRTLKGSSVLPAGTSAYSRSVRFCFHSAFLDNRTEGCPFPGP